jgi:hypothetical protein
VFRADAPGYAEGEFAYLSHRAEPGTSPSGTPLATMTVRLALRKKRP